MKIIWNDTLSNKPASLIFLEEVKHSVYLNGNNAFLYNYCANIGFNSSLKEIRPL